MAMVSGGRSTLNPNAPLFIPAALQQVEDFSPEWWDLVKSSTWFRDYWINLHQEEAFDDTTNEYIDGDSNDVADLLPESFDLCFDDEFPILEAQLEELVETEEDNNRSSPFLMGKEITQNGQQIDLKALMKNQNLSKERGPKFANEPAKYLEKRAKCISPKCTPRRIQQPR